jgi:aspartate kinase
MIGILSLKPPIFALHSPQVIWSLLTLINMPLIVPQRPWIVQKYGGTSLGKLLSMITNNIIPEYLGNNHVAVVCSAMSGTAKSFGTTSLLLQAIDHAMSSTKGNKELNVTIDNIRDQHLESSRQLQVDADPNISPSVFSELDDSIVDDCEELRGFLLAAQVSYTSYQITLD